VYRDEIQQDDRGRHAEWKAQAGMPMFLLVDYKPVLVCHPNTARPLTSL
jgi:hypothetical protein